MRVERYCLFWVALLDLLCCSYWHTTWILINRLTWDNDKNYEWFSIEAYPLFTNLEILMWWYTCLLSKSSNEENENCTNRATYRKWFPEILQQKPREGESLRGSHVSQTSESQNTIPNTNTKTNTKTNTSTNTGRNIKTNANTHRRYWDECLRESLRRSHVLQASESHVPGADTYVQFCTVMNHYQGWWLQGLKQSDSVNMFCKIFWNIFPTSAIIRMDKIHIAF